MTTKAGTSNGEKEDVSIKLGEVKRQLTKERAETIYLIELLRRCVVAFNAGLYDYEILKDVVEELSLREGD